MATEPPRAPEHAIVTLRPGVTYVGMHRIRVSHLVGNSVFKTKVTLFVLVPFVLTMILFVLGGPLWPLLVVSVVLGTQLMDLFVALGQMFAQAGRLEREK